jgi:monovalent cation:H+ antiporter, CPA1 family
MVSTIPILLSLFSLLALSAGVYFLAERIRVPYTVLLVAIGTFVLVPLSSLPFFSFLRTFTFTPEILFYVFLPILIFESAYNISVRRLMENVWTISVLSVLSLLISAGSIAYLLYVGLPMVGIEVPFIVCVLFGSLISATDPVAVLALFKELGAPKRLTLLFEGESIFNDGTAVALFLVVLSVAVHGWHGSTSIVEGVSMFAIMIVAGVILGALLGTLFVWAVAAARRSEYVQISLMIVLAHLTFILSDFISQQVSIAGHPIHVSAIISTTIASIIMGNYGRAYILPHAREFVEKFWTQTALLANSLVFLLIGLIFVALPIPVTQLIVPISIAVVVVAISRAVSIYPVLWGLNRVAYEAPIPMSWQHLLAWGSLRGALAITMVLLIPANLTIASWNLAYTPREFILALTIGCIFITLFIKATTIKGLARRLGTSDLTPLEELQYGQVTAQVHIEALARLRRFQEKGYIDDRTATMLIAEHDKKLEAVLQLCEKQLLLQGEDAAERVLRFFTIGVEQRRLEDLYQYGEVSEVVYRMTQNKLALQYEEVEEGGVPSGNTPVARGLGKGIVYLRDFFRKKTAEAILVERYMYYRTLVILARTVLRALRDIDAQNAVRMFGTRTTERMVSVYETFLSGSRAKLQSLEQEAPNLCRLLAEQLARRSVLEVEARTLDELFEREMMSSKVHMAVHDAIRAHAEVR